MSGLEATQESTTSLPTTRHATAAEGRRAILVMTSGAVVGTDLADGLAEGRLSAIDAALAGAFAQIVTAAGAWASFAGVLSAAHYDPATGVVEVLDAGFNLPGGETDPWSIPPTGKPSGRATLTPGFMAGAAEAHARHGQAPWRELFGPAIKLAEAGIPVDETLARLIEFRRTVLTRTPEGRAIFAPGGRPLEEGDTLRQRELASTLRRVAERGAEEMYRGEWANSFVERVRAEGGRLDKRDLEAYEAAWDEPLTTRYAGAELSGLGLPQLSGLCLAEALSVLEGSGGWRGAHYSEDPEALLRLVRASHLCYVRFLDPAPEATAARLAQDRLKRQVPAAGASPLVPLVDRLAGPAPPKAHSDIIIAVDARGRVAVLCHSINTTAWGTTGLFVGGVSIPDAGAFQQRLLARLDPGTRVPNGLSPVIVRRDGEVSYAMGGIGASVAETMLQATVNLLDFDYMPAEAAGAPMVLRSLWPQIGPFQLALFVAAALIFLPTAGIGLAAGFRTPDGFGVRAAVLLPVALAALANLSFAAGVYLAWRHGCRACLTAVDVPGPLALLGALGVIAAIAAWVLGLWSTLDRALLGFAALACLAFGPVLRGSLVPVSIIEPDSFRADVIEAAERAGQPFHVIERDPPRGFWAGVAVRERRIEGAVSPHSLDGIAIGR